MNRTMWMAAALACAVSVGVAATDDNKITVTGCVQNFSSSSAIGTTERGFLLANATIVVEPSAGAPVPEPTQRTTAAGTPTGTSGTAAPGMPTSDTWPAITGGALATKSSSRSSYRLEGDEAELKAQVGHKVEVTGAVAPRPEGAAKTDAQRLQIASIKMVSSACSK